MDFVVSKISRYTSSGTTLCCVTREHQLATKVISTFKDKTIRERSP